LYLCVIKDLYDGAIAAWKTGTRPTAEWVTSTVEMALVKRPESRGAILCIRTTVVNTPATRTVSVCNKMVYRSVWEEFGPVPTTRRQKAFLDSLNEN